MTAIQPGTRGRVDVARRPTRRRPPTPTSTGRRVASPAQRRRWTAQRGARRHPPSWHRSNCPLDRVRGTCRRAPTSCVTAAHAVPRAAAIHAACGPRAQVAVARPRRGWRGTSRSCARRPSSNGICGPPAEQLLGARGVDAPAGLAVGLGRVPAQLAVEADEAGDRLDRLADRDLVVGAEVDRLGAVVDLGRQHDGLGGVVDVEVLAARPAGAPHLDLVLAALDRLDALLDQRRDDVRDRRVELVAGPVQVGRDEVRRSAGRTAPR